MNKLRLEYRITLFRFVIVLLQPNRFVFNYYLWYDWLNALIQDNSCNLIFFNSSKTFLFKLLGFLVCLPYLLLILYSLGHLSNWNSYKGIYGLSWLFFFNNSKIFILLILGSCVEKLKMKTASRLRYAYIANDARQ